MGGGWVYDDVMGTIRGVCADGAVKLTEQGAKRPAETDGRTDRQEGQLTVSHTPSNCIIFMYKQKATYAMTHTLADTYTRTSNHTHTHLPRVPVAGIHIPRFHLPH